MQEKNVKLMYSTKFIWHSFVKLYLWIFLFSVPFSGNYWFTFFLLASIFVGIPYMFYILLYYYNTSFTFDNDKIVKRSGIIIKSSSAIHFNKIQNIDLKSDLLMRFFQMTLINIWTASQSQLSMSEDRKNVKPEIYLFLDTPEAEELRTFIIDKENRDKAIDGEKNNNFVEKILKS